MRIAAKRVGVLIDNLEPALDGQGKFIAPHRRYVELLRVLADASVKSLTLITSREPLAEGLSISSYPLPSLGEEAWASFFGSRGLEVEATILKEIHRAYGGNALAMTILCDPILRDGGMGAYWREHKIEAGLLVELAVENLVKEQFDRLEKISPEAYLLLCRLGCYRYQDVPTVPTEGLLCLLWDVSEARLRKVIKFLQSWSLVECNKGEYWLHPIIREQAISRLRERYDWKITNHKAAEFWTESVKAVETSTDAMRASEAIHHYLDFKDFDQATTVILKTRDSEGVKDESLIRSFYRLGLLEQMIFIINLLVSDRNIKEKKYASEIYNGLGSMYWLKGQIHKAIEFYLIAKDIAFEFSIEEFKLTSLVNIALCQLDLGKIEEALDLFLEYEILAKNSELNHHILISYFSLAFLYSLSGNYQEAYRYARQFSGEILLKGHPWDRGYRLIFLGMTYRNLDEFEKSFEMYHMAIAYAEESHYTQVKAKALCGLAELYRQQEDFEIALSHHKESIELLEKIGAKCDLAEAYYQLALTYQAMGEPEQSQEYFAKAIHLYEEMEAPKQVEKVRRAIPLNPPSKGGL